VFQSLSRCLLRAWLLVMLMTTVLLAMPMERRAPYLPSHYGYYHINRPHYCRDEAVHRDCYVCGKFAGSSELIYTGCCRQEANFLDFCSQFT
jgi:hypothetical protein